MIELSRDTIADIAEKLTAHRLPRWRELPDLELYMDQVVALIDRYLRGYPGYDAKGLTAAMVNNYVKLGAMPAPVKKKYAREHLAYLLIICILKASLPIAAIQKLITAGAVDASTDTVYDRFCVLFEEANAVAATPGNNIPADAEPIDLIFRAALMAQAEQAMATKLVAAMFPEE